MGFNSFGELFVFNSFGESHGKAIGVSIDGVPAGIKLNLDLIQEALNKRRPGTSNLVSNRKEPDKLEILSGLYAGITTGAPLAFLVYNLDIKKKDYLDFAGVFRPSHADFSYFKKFNIYDQSGGGRASARETIARVIAGSVALQILPKDLKIQAQVIEILGETNQDLFEGLVLKAKQNGDSLGGVVEVVATGVPIGLGEPVYQKLDAKIAFAMMSIPACKAIEIGSGTKASKLKGTEHNDQISKDHFLSNFAGGILGGISNGEPIIVRLTFKPTASILIEQTTVNQNGDEVKLKLKGRHDPCVCLRAPIIVESMLACVLADFYLINKIRNKTCLD